MIAFHVSYRLYFSFVFIVCDLDGEGGGRKGQLCNCHQSAGNDEKLKIALEIDWTFSNLLPKSHTSNYLSMIDHCQCSFYFCALQKDFRDKFLRILNENKHHKSKILLTANFIFFFFALHGKRVMRNVIITSQSWLDRIHHSYLHALHSVLYWELKKNLFYLILERNNFVSAFFLVIDLVLQIELRMKIEFETKFYIQAKNDRYLFYQKKKNSFKSSNKRGMIQNSHVDIHCDLFMCPY